MDRHHIEIKGVLDSTAEIKGVRKEKQRAPTRKE
jgi:hypothetical protein